MRHPITPALPPMPHASRTTQGFLLDEDRGHKPTNLHFYRERISATTPLLLGPIQTPRARSIFMCKLGFSLDCFDCGNVAQSPDSRFDPLYGARLNASSPPAKSVARTRTDSTFQSALSLTACTHHPPNPTTTESFIDFHAAVGKSCRYSRAHVCSIVVTLSGEAAPRTAPRTHSL